MFTGIITGVGRIAALHDLGSSLNHGKRLTIKAPPGYLDDVGLGDSIALNGACMTVTSLDLPQHQFTISESRTDSLVAGLEDGSIDLALIATPPREGAPRLVTSDLFEDEFVLATPPGDQTVAPVPLASIDRRRILLLDEGHCLRQQTLAACAIDPGQARSTFAATSLSTIVVVSIIAVVVVVVAHHCHPPCCRLRRGRFLCRHRHLRRRCRCRRRHRFCHCCCHRCCCHHHNRRHCSRG